MSDTVGKLPSPCVSVCEMDYDTGLCKGCFRTLAEIAGWCGFSDEERLDVIAKLRERRGLPPRPRRRAR
jgi:predicted Fe-S protein YdhL (DUF1289 family)